MTTVIIVNRHAGCMRSDPSLARRLRVTCGEAATLHVTANLLELRDVCVAAAERGVTTVGIVGGDGTGSATLTALWQAYGDKPLPRIALLRGGTMNTIATSLGISRRKPSVLLARTLRLLRDPEPAVRHHPVMNVAGRLGFLFGTGVWHGYLAESYKHGQPSRLTNAAVLGRVLASAAVGGDTFARIAARTELSVRFADGTWPARPYLTIAAGTVADAGFGFRPFPRISRQPEGLRAFHMLALKGSPLEALRDFPRVWLGHGFRHHTAEYVSATWAELESTSGSFGYAIDGDVALAQGSLRVSAGPVFAFLPI